MSKKEDHKIFIPWIFHTEEAIAQFKTKFVQYFLVCGNRPYREFGKECRPKRPTVCKYTFPHPNWGDGFFSDKGISHFYPLHQEKFNIPFRDWSKENNDLTHEDNNKMFWCLVNTFSHYIQFTVRRYNHKNETFSKPITENTPYGEAVAIYPFDVNSV